MDFDYNNVKQVVEEDRLSSLPDELIQKIMSSFDMKFVVQTCLLSSRWKLLWTSMSCLNLSSEYFRTLRKFDKFVNHVLTHCNHQTEVSSVKLHFQGELNQVFVRKIADFAFSHNVQELAVVRSGYSSHAYPHFVFRSQSLKHFTFNCCCCNPPFSITPETPWDFPALTTLHLSYITLGGDLFSKCRNLKDLTVKRFHVKGLEEAFDIITPRLSSLMLKYGQSSKVINVIAPQLENLTVIDCSFQYLNAPPALSSLCYRSRLWPCVLPQFSNDRFHSLNKVSLRCCPKMPYDEEDTRKIINMLQKLHSARYLTLDWKSVECISSFPYLLSHYPSPFSNLMCLTIDCSKKNDAFKATISGEARTFLLQNSPSAMLTMEFPKALVWYINMFHKQPQAIKVRCEQTPIFTTFLNSVKQL